MFTQYGGEPPAEPQTPPRRSLAEWLRSMPPWQLLVTGVPPLAASLVLHVLAAGWTLECRTAATTSCVETEHVLFGLVPIGREEIPDVRAARVVISRGTRRSPGTYYYRVTLDTAAGEHNLTATSSLEAAYGAVNEINEAIRTRVARVETSLGFVLFDALLRLVALLLSILCAGFTVLGLVRLIRPPA
jgi:hypothetical protein